MNASFQPPDFGTDGLRGRAGEPPLDPETLRRVGAALGLWLQRSGPERKRVVAGHDGRDSAAWILESLAQGLAVTDAQCTDVGLVTTPALAHIARTGPFVAALMISASHDPATDNGVKIFTGDGRKLDDAAERAIAALTVEVAPPASVQTRVQEGARQLAGYEEHLVTAFAERLGGIAGTTVVFDAANGAASVTGPMVLRHFGADVVAIGCEPDGFNINDGVGALHPDAARAAVAGSGAVLGICLDGDGDRCILIDEQGRIRDGDDVLYTLAPRMRADGDLPHDTVVGTVMSNLGLRRALEADGLQFVETPVGDRRVAEAMRAGGFALGAEPSGHVLLRPDPTEPDHLIGDGLWTALTILALPGIAAGASRCMRTFERFPQRLVNVPVRAKPPFAEIPAITAAIAAAEAALGRDGRIVLRYSGTEDLCRVMVEAREAALVDEHVDALAATVREAIGR